MPRFERAQEVVENNLGKILAATWVAGAATAMIVGLDTQPFEVAMPPGSLDGYQAQQAVQHPIISGAVNGIFGAGITAGYEIAIATMYVAGRSALEYLDSISQK